MIKAGTLEKLVESLTTDTGELESTYMNIFLSTYRSFASPSQVLSILLNRLFSSNYLHVRFLLSSIKVGKLGFEGGN
ncbi:UNVERIFIED_CONTAM: Rgl1 [Trichonephila clavipes]